MSNNDILKLIQKMIDEHIEENIKVDDIASELGMSRMQLHRRIKIITGKSLSGYILSVKMKKAEYLLLHTQYKVKDIALNIGYTDSSYFSKVFKKEKKHLPKAYRMKYSMYYQ